MRLLIIPLIVAVSSSSLAATLEVHLDPAHAVLEPGRAADTEIQIHALDVQGQPVRASDIVLHTSAGAISALRTIEPGRFSATLSRPAAGFPQLSVVTAANLAATGHDEAPLLTQAVIAYSARITLRGQSEPDSEVSLIVGDKSYEAGVSPDGTFATTVIVPPGVSFATGVARDALGNTSRWPIDLFLPDVRRVYGFVYPEQVEANGRGHVFVTALSSNGGPDPVAQVRVSARDGKIGEPREIAPGLMHFAYRAPVRLTRTSDLLHLHRDESKAGVDFPVRLTPAPPVTIEAAPVLVRLDSPATIPVEVRDAFGNQIETPHVWIQQDGHRARLPSPIVLDNPSQETSRTVELVSAPEARPCRAPWIGIEEQRLRVVDAVGVPCGGTYRVIDEHGKDVRRGQLVDGFVSGGVSANQQIVIDDGHPSLPKPTDALPRYRVPSTTVDITWHRPLPVMLSVRWLEPGRRVVINSTEANALTRIELRTIGMRVVGSQQGEAGLEVEVTDVVAGARLIVSDPRTGVSAWIGVQ
ncbi:MAG: hypothetical protein AAFP04_03430 [Myxococcota bacterium]